MKLCAIVFDVHHTPAAMTGAGGPIASTAPPAAASATMTASYCVSRDSDRRRTKPVMGSLAVVDQRLDRRVRRVGADAGHPRVRHVRVGRVSRLRRLSEARLQLGAVPERD